MLKEGLGERFSYSYVTAASAKKNEPPQRVTSQVCHDTKQFDK